MAGRIFVVEDEPDLAALMADYARASGYTVDIFSDGAKALHAVRMEPPDLLVLDWMLPGLDGLSVCRAVRTFSELPIIMVTARVEEIDRLVGLESGADDYLCKPFSPREWVARIRVILRRAATTLASTPAPSSDFEMDVAAQQIRVRGQGLELTPTEFQLLAALIRRPGHVFSRAQLLDLALPDALDVTDRAVDSHIKNLRRKLAQVMPDAEPIQSVYGIGYRFEA